MISIRNDRGEELARKVVGVGALAPNEGRTVTLSVDVFTATGPVGRSRAPRDRCSAGPRTRGKKELPEPQRSLQSMEQGTSQAAQVGVRCRGYIW